MRSKVKIIFHIGQHKTGSKALQSFLAHHARALGSRGILYPAGEDSSHGIRAYAFSHYRMFALLRREAMAACGDRDASVRFWEEQGKYCQPFDSLRGFFESLEAQRARIGAGTILLSAEDLFDMHSAHETGFSMGYVEPGAQLLARLAEEFNYNPKVVVYLRRQDHLLCAHYVQFIKGSALHDLDFESFTRIFAPRLRTLELLEAWASVFGVGRILVRPYEPSAVPLNVVPDFFQNVLGLSVPADWTSPSRDPESVNATPDRDHVEFMRILNRRSARGLPVFAREDVLQAALGEGAHSGAGVSAWLSPAARRTLLESHAQDNAKIAKRYLGRPAGQSLFTEPVPELNADWHEYPGLSAERANAIELTVRKIASSRKVNKRSKWHLSLLRAFRGDST